MIVEPVPAKPEPAVPISTTARSSALFALPFGIAMMVAVIALTAMEFAVQPWLTALLALSLWVPAAVELILRSPLPRALQLHYIIFIIAGPFAGSALNVYVAIADWDTLIHFDSGVMLAWLGMLAVRRVEERTRQAVPMWFALVVIQVTAMAFAAAWEMCEFASDVLIGTVSQSGLDDTMLDITAGTLGGLLAITLLILLKRPRTLAPHSLLRETRDPAAPSPEPES